MWSLEPGPSWCSSSGRKPRSQENEGRQPGSADICMESDVSTACWNLYALIFSCVTAVSSVHCIQCSLPPPCDSVTVWTLCKPQSADTFKLGNNCNNSQWFPLYHYDLVNYWRLKVKNLKSILYTVKCTVVHSAVYSQQYTINYCAHFNLSAWKYNSDALCTTMPTAKIQNFFLLSKC